MKILFCLLSSLYGVITRTRNLLFDLNLFGSYKSSLPVMSVGNITAGGSGKTPCVMYLCKLVKDLGKKPVVLSRGYGGKVTNIHVVTSHDKAEEVGDEPLLIRLRTGVEVVVCPDRVRGAKYIQEHKVGDVIILDDGFQHRWLKRDLDIVCVFTGDETSLQQFEKGELLPSGRFRELRDQALKRASCVICGERSFDSLKNETIERLKKYVPQSVKLFQSHLIKPLLQSLTGEQMLQGGKVTAVASIANPEGFLKSIETVGLTVEHQLFFGDHYPYTEEDVQRIIDMSKGKPIVCTEKDWVKLKEFTIPNLFVLAGELEIVPKGEFDSLVRRIIK